MASGSLPRVPRTPFTSNKAPACRRTSAATHGKEQKEIAHLSSSLGPQGCPFPVTTTSLPVLGEGASPLLLQAREGLQRHREQGQSQLGWPGSTAASPAGRKPLRRESLLQPELVTAVLTQQKGKNAWGKGKRALSQPSTPRRAPSVQLG